MDVKVFGLWFLLWSVVAGLESLNDYSEQLFRKYSASISHLSVSELENLWIQLLSKNETVPINPRNDSWNCLNTQQIFNLGTNNGQKQFDQEALKQVCPLILFQLDSELCSNYLEEDQESTTAPNEGKKKPTSTEVWGYGVLFVTLISGCSLVGVSVLPMMGKAFYSKLLTALIGLAVGSLSGSSVFHLIPQAFKLPDEDPDHRYLEISLLLFAGIWLFFMIERLLKIMMDWKDRKNKEHNLNQPNHIPLFDPKRNPGAANNFCVAPEIDKILESQEQVIKASFGHQAKPQRSHSHEHMVHFKSGDSPIATVAWMIIFGDGFHNFIDGLSLGAAFNESIPTGMSISLAVLCEELPHELGDFAVLLSAGMTMRQALLYNFLSACTCYLGLALGIILGEFEASQYIFAIAGGMFLYISLVDMVPEMNEVAEEASRQSVAEALKILALQNVGVILGVCALFVLAKFQDQIRIG